MIYMLFSRVCVKKHDFSEKVFPQISGGRTCGRGRRLRPKAAAHGPMGPMGPYGPHGHPLEPLTPISRCWALGSFLKRLGKGGYDHTHLEGVPVYPRSSHLGNPVWRASGRVDDTLLLGYADCRPRSHLVS